MKKIRERFKEMKEGFLTAKSDAAFPAYVFANAIFICLIYIIAYAISVIVYHNLSNIAGLCMIAISTILLFVFILCDRAFSKTMPISARIFTHLFGRYGLVVSKDDWKLIKKYDKEAYKFIWDKENIGHCYAVAWVLALRIKDAKIMYCSVAGKDGPTGHSVVVKNNCVYDTNFRRHYDYDEYLRNLKGEVYKIFEKEDYCTKSFFDDIRQGFVDWCAERNVYCDPQQ